MPQKMSKIHSNHMPGPGDSSPPERFEEEVCPECGEDVEEDSMEGVRRCWMCDFEEELPEDPRISAYEDRMTEVRD